MGAETTPISIPQPPIRIAALTIGDSYQGIAFKVRSRRISSRLFVDLSAGFYELFGLR